MIYMAVYIYGISTVVSKMVLNVYIFLGIVWKLEIPVS